MSNANPYEGPIDGHLVEAAQKELARLREHAEKAKKASKHEYEARVDVWAIAQHVGLNSWHIASVEDASVQAWGTTRAEAKAKFIGQVASWIQRNSQVSWEVARRRACTARYHLTGDDK